MAVTEKAVRDALKTVKDPELNIDLVTLGLVYDIQVEGNAAKAIISLTSPMCPVAGEIVEQARSDWTAGSDGAGRSARSHR